VSKTSIKKIAAKDADQYMLRLPPGLRNRLARRAAENGRSMNTEIVAAIEQHLTSADRVTQLWELFGKHREDIEAIPAILAAVAKIEDYLGRSGSGDIDAPAVLQRWAWRKREDARVASLPLVTADQVQKIKARLKEANRDEKKLLAVMRVPRIEDIRDFDHAMGVLDSVIARNRSEPRRE
jgi:plasmid stability protein